MDCPNSSSGSGSSSTRANKAGGWKGLQDTDTWQDGYYSGAKMREINFWFGDHQPAISARILNPSLDDAAVKQRFMLYDPRYFSTYYAIDTINFKPVDLSSALDTLDAPYLPLVIQEAAGLPLDPTFVEQKKILERCKGSFYSCAAGAEARRFNRLLIDSGLIKGL